MARTVHARTRSRRGFTTHTDKEILCQLEVPAPDDAQDEAPVAAEAA